MLLDNEEMIEESELDSVPTLTPQEIEDNRKASEERIHEAIIETQKIISKLTNMIDAFGRDYDSPKSNAQIFIWANSIEGSIKKARGTSKELLVSDGKAKTISLPNYNVDVTFTSGGISLDAMKFKKMDRSSYDYIAKMFPRVSKPRATVKIIEKKGAGITIGGEYEDNQED